MLRNDDVCFFGSMRASRIVSVRLGPVSVGRRSRPMTSTTNGRFGRPKSIGAPPGNGTVSRVEVNGTVSGCTAVATARSA